ncbi:MAG: TolC family protein [Oceanobacter sp.]
MKFIFDTRRGVAVLGLLILNAPTFATEPPLGRQLTLSQASRLTLENHPDFRLWQWQEKTRQADRDIAALKPGYQLSLQGDNLIGTGSHQGFDQAELGLSLSSVIELGNKRERRMDSATAALSVARARQQVRSLDLLAQVAHTYASALSLQAQERIQLQAAQLAQQALDVVRRRVKRGASPESEAIRADANLIRSRLALTSISARLSAEKARLASYWGATEDSIPALHGSLSNLPVVGDFTELYQRSLNAPATAVFASEQRWYETERQRVIAQSSTNIEWQAGLTRFQSNGDVAASAGVSIPLFQSSRNQAAVRRITTEQQAAQIQQESTLQALRPRLFDAWQRYTVNRKQTLQLAASVIPALELAVDQTRTAYERGRYRYSDWSVARQELLDARFSRIDAATRALHAQITIEHMTAQPLIKR